MDLLIPARRPNWVIKMDHLIPARRPNWVIKTDLLIPARRPNWVIKMDNLILARRPDWVIKMKHLILARRPKWVIINKIKKRTYYLVDFAVPEDHIVKIKERETKHKGSDLAREPKKLWNMRVMGKSTITGAFGTVLKELKIAGQIETIQTTTLLSSVE